MASEIESIVSKKSINFVHSSYQPQFSNGVQFDGPQIYKTSKGGKHKPSKLANYNNNSITAHQYCGTYEGALLTDGLNMNPDAAYLQEEQKNNEQLFNQPTVNMSLYQPAPMPMQRRLYRHYSSHLNTMVYGVTRRLTMLSNKLRIDSTPPADLLKNGPWDDLNLAMWNYFIENMQKEGTYMKKIDVWRAIFMLCKECPKNYSVYFIGSTMTGFATDDSDIDLCLLTMTDYNEQGINTAFHLGHMKCLLECSGLVTDATLIMARVPILKFTARKNGYQVDMSFNQPVGIHNTYLLYSYARMDWRVRPLVVIIKLWARANKINDAKKMGISSYSWVLLVIHYLQCGVSPAILPCLHELHPEKFGQLTPDSLFQIDFQEDIEGFEQSPKNMRCLGDLLIGFFNYYSFFDFSKYAISVRTASVIPIEVCKHVKTSQNDLNQWKFICIEEPFTRSNTARSIFNYSAFEFIKNVIFLSYKALVQHKLLSRIIPLQETSMV